MVVLGTNNTIVYNIEKFIKRRKTWKNGLKKVATIILILGTLFINSGTYAHSGRTDSNGGHRDNKNKSGLGSYHYHCGGYPAHLHTNGQCPYKTQKNESTVNNRTKEEAPKEIKATKIVIEQGKTSMKVGDVQYLTTAVEPTNTTDKIKEWTSSNPEIVTVTEYGKITAKQIGKAYITVKMSNGIYNTISVTVEDEQQKNKINRNTNVQNSQEQNTEEQHQVGATIGGIATLGAIGGAVYYVNKRK